MIIAKLDFRFNHKETRTGRNIKFDLKAKDQYTPEGDWVAADKTSKQLSKIYFGDDAGWWQMNAAAEVGRTITFWDQAHATGIKVLWTDMSVALLSMHKVPILPFHTGDEGWGAQYAHPGHHFTWKVVG